MKLTIQFFAFLIIAVTILSCSQEETIKAIDLKGGKPDKSGKLYKRSEGALNGELKVIQEIFYGKNNRIDSVIRENIGFEKEIFTVKYRGNNISNIDYKWSNGEYNFKVTTSNNYIKLEDPNRILEIYHSAEYIDSTKSINPSNINSISFNQFFERNEKDQLISNGWNSYPDDYDVYFYSNFDTGKQAGPLNTVIEIPNDESILYLILGIKLSKNNPLTIELSYGESYSMTLNYDDDGYVTQGIWNFDNSFVESHYYLEH
jgi:hypothetical protein